MVSVDVSTALTCVCRRVTADMPLNVGRRFDAQSTLDLCVPVHRKFHEGGSRSGCVRRGRALGDAQIAGEVLLHRCVLGLLLCHLHAAASERARHALSRIAWHAFAVHAYSPREEAMPTPCGAREAPSAMDSAAREHVRFRPMIALHPKKKRTHAKKQSPRRTCRIGTCSNSNSRKSKDANASCKRDWGVVVRATASSVSRSHCRNKLVPDGLDSASPPTSLLEFKDDTAVEEGRATWCRYFSNMKREERTFRAFPLDSGSDSTCFIRNVDVSELNNAKILPRTGWHIAGQNGRKSTLFVSKWVCRL